MYYNETVVIKRMCQSSWCLVDALLPPSSLQPLQFYCRRTLLCWMSKWKVLKYRLHCFCFMWKYLTFCSDWRVSWCYLVLSRTREFLLVCRRSRLGSFNYSRQFPEFERLKMLMSSVVTSFSWETLGLICIIQQMSIQLYKLVQAVHTLKTEDDLATVMCILEKMTVVTIFFNVSTQDFTCFCSQSRQS